MKRMWTLAAFSLLAGLNVANSQARADQPQVYRTPSNQGAAYAQPANQGVAVYTRPASQGAGVYTQPANQGAVYAQPNPADAYLQANGGCANCAAGAQQGQAGATQPKKGAFERVKGFFKGPGCGCLPNSEISCSNLQQEYQFIFGSCRNFFGNPCFKTPEQLLSISEGEYLGRVSPGINRVNRTYP
ncbi:hypothetical protein BH10PLA2_BH10PLA2_26530 [soil metagenome]